MNEKTYENTLKNYKIKKLLSKNKKIDIIKIKFR